MLAVQLYMRALGMLVQNVPKPPPVGITGEVMTGVSIEAFVELVVQQMECQDSA